MLNRYQRPNNDPSSRVLNKLLCGSAVSPALSAVAETSKRFLPGSEATGGTEVHGLSLKSDEETDQDRRDREAERASLVEEVRPPRGFDEAETRIGSNLGVKVWVDSLRGLGRERDGERVKAAVCIFDAQTSRSERRRRRGSETVRVGEREREKVLEESVQAARLVGGFVYAERNEVRICKNEGGLENGKWEIKMAME